MIDSILTLSYLFAQSFGNPRTTSVFAVKSPAFVSHRLIPYSYTCYGKGQPIPLHWQGVPKGTKSLVILMTDEDTPRQQSDHYLWVAFNIPANMDHLDANSSFAHSSWGKEIYQPPCPAEGLHHYEIRLYALNTFLPKQDGHDPVTLRKEMQQHILATTEITGQVKSIQ